MVRSNNIEQQASLVYRYVGLKVSGAYLAWLEDLYKGMRTSITVVLFVATTCSLSLLFPQCVYLFTSEIKELRILVQMIGANVCHLIQLHKFSADLGPISALNLCFFFCSAALKGYDDWCFEVQVWFVLLRYERAINVGVTEDC
ncbi:hypothetical protein BD560DRAFT_427716 [Blakeslea trispora]|nr:hypothetical protein BD560DRAFT_427716 [Blakeslea trispora]